MRVLNTFMSMHESSHHITDLAVEAIVASAVDVLVDGDKGSMTPDLVDTVFASGDNLKVEELVDAQLKVISGTFDSMDQARQFLLRLFNPGSPAVGQRHDVFHRIHLEDALPVEGYLG
jgi:hypothetical protein